MSFFRPRTSLSSKPNLAESFARLIKRLPDQFGKIAIENTTLQQYLDKIATNFQSSSDLIQQMDGLFKKLPQTNENAVLFMQIMAGFLHAFKKDSQVNLMKDSVLEVYLDQATQLLEHKTTDMMTRMPVQAMKLGMTMANYTSAIPDVVKEVKKYEALLTRFKPSMDYMGLNPFESRALEVKSGKPHQTFEVMLNQLDLTKQTAKTTPENHRIHLIWMGSIPKQYFDNIKSWKEKNPAYEVVLYIDRGDQDADFLAWCKAQKIKLVMIDNVISSHPAYKYFVYERSLPNYGAASDIARYILLQFYGGLYFDVPDIFCKKALPELKEDILCHKQGLYSNNNDCLAAITSKGKAVFEATLNTISTQYQTGYAGLGQRSKMTMEPIWLMPRTVRRMKRTLAYTGINNIQYYFPGAELDLVKESIQVDLAGTWIKQTENSQHKEAKEQASLADAITEILLLLRLEPRVIDFDKYPVFVDIENLKIAIGFLKTYFKENLESVVYVAAYKTANLVEVARLLDRENFPELYQPYVAIICKAQVEESESDLQMKLLAEFFKENKDNKEAGDDYGNTPFLAACRNFNSKVIRFLLTQDVNLSAVNKMNQNAIDLIVVIEMDFTEDKAKNLAEMKEALADEKSLLDEICNRNIKLLVNVDDYFGCCINKAIKAENFYFADVLLDKIIENFDVLCKEKDFFKMRDHLQIALDDIEFDSSSQNNLDPLKEKLANLLDKMNALKPANENQDKKEDAHRFYSKKDTYVSQDEEDYMEKIREARKARDGSSSDSDNDDDTYQHRP